MAADLLDRLMGQNLDQTLPEERKLPVHQFFGALMAYADGRLTRVQIETVYDIPNTGPQSLDMDFLISSYTGISGGASALREIKFLDRVHGIFMMAETAAFSTAFSKADIKTWLTDVADGTV